MVFRRWPIGLEILLAVLRTKGGLLAIYLIIYLAYTGLTKLTESLGRIASQVKKKIDPKDIPQMIEYENPSGWYKLIDSNRHKAHWYDEGELYSLCNRASTYSETEKLLCDEDHCKTCEKKRKVNG